MKRRLPPGSGSISKLSGDRRKPYMVRASGNRKVIGYAESYKQAFQMLQQFNQNPYDLDLSKLTFKDVYNGMVDTKTDVSPQAIRGYQASFKAVPGLHGEKFCKLRLKHLQEALNESGKGYATQLTIVNTIKQMYKYAIKYEIVDRNYSEMLAVEVKNDIENGVPYTPEDLRVLKNKIGDPVVDMLLIMCYSGFRISEYQDIKIEGGYFCGGVKTEAGKDRIVPVHPGIADLLPHIWRGHPETFRRASYRKLADLGIEKHTPHDCRHTFSWMCDKYKVDRLSKVLMLGHSLSNAGVTDKVYGHRTPEELKEEIEKIPF